MRTGTRPKTQRPITKAKSPGKQVTPFTPGRKREGTTVSFVGHGVDAAEFTSMLELAPERSGSSSALAQSLYDLSIKLRKLTDVLDQIHFFKKMAPLPHYRYRSILELIYAAAKCPPDAQYLLLTIAARMVKLDNFATREELHQLAAACENLIRGKLFYVSFGDDQEKPNRKLQEMWQLFKQKRRETREVKIRMRATYDTKSIEAFIQEQLRRTASGERLISEDEIEDYLRTSSAMRSQEPSGSDAAEEGVSLDQSQDPQFSGSVDRFLGSKDNLMGRIDRGSKMYSHLSPEEVQKIEELAKLFVRWEKAYDACKVVWNLMKEDDSFDVDILISQVPVSFADFLIEALKTFAANEGIPVPDIQNPGM